MRCLDIFFFRLVFVPPWSPHPPELYSSGYRDEGPVEEPPRPRVDAFLRPLPFYNDVARRLIDEYPARICRGGLFRLWVSFYVGLVGIGVGGEAARRIGSEAEQPPVSQIQTLKDAGKTWHSSESEKQKPARKKTARNVLVLCIYLHKYMNR